MTGRFKDPLMLPLMSEKEENNKEEKDNKSFFLEMIR